MEKLINELLSILKLQIEVYQDMLGLSKKKTNIVVEGRVSELEKIVKIEQTMVIKSGKLEEKREQLENELADILKINKKDINISTLIKHLDEKHKQQLEFCRQKLIEIINELKKVNNLNSQLIKNALEYIDFSINLFTNVNSTGNEYEGKGNTVENKNAKSVFDVKL